MSFATFKTRLKLHLWRQNDDDLDGQVDEISLMAEARLNRDLRLRNMVTSSDITFTPPTDPAVPSDFLEAIEAVYKESASGASTPMRYVTPQQMEDMKEDYTSPGALWYTIRGSSIVLHKMPDAVTGGTQYVRLWYYQKVPVFSTTDSSYIYDAHPDLYLYACLMEAADFIDDPQRSGQYRARYGDILNDVIRHEVREKVGPRPVIRRKGFVA